MLNRNETVRSISDEAAGTACLPAGRDCLTFGLRFAYIHARTVFLRWVQDSNLCRDFSLGFSRPAHLATLPTHQFTLSLSKCVGTACLPAGRDCLTFGLRFAYIHARTVFLRWVQDSNLCSPKAYAFQAYAFDHSANPPN